MAESSLQERLRQSQKSFDGLLSLIPAKMYYGEDTSDQWQRKKQTKAQAAEARRNKLDPDSELNRSVKEVMDEQARKKRKRDQQQNGDDDDEWSDVDGIEAETPGQGLKKRKVVQEEVPELTEQEQRKEDKKQARKERKAERKVLREEEAAYERRNVKSGVNKIKLGARDPKAESSAINTSVKQPSKNQLSAAETMVSEDEQNEDEDEGAAAEEEAHEEVDDESVEASEIDRLNLPVLDTDVAEHPNDAASTSESDPQSPLFDTHGTPVDSNGQTSTTTSISSVVPVSDKPSPAKMAVDNSALKARLAAKIQALRDARKADGPDGKPVRTRQELIESRRQKQAERKAHKKELRQKAKEEEDRKREEALASARTSPGSILSPAIDLADNSFSFGRVAFGDGAQLSQDLSHVLSNGPKKGPSDPKTALLKLQNEKKRLDGMSAEKREDVEDKEAWLKARKKASGERIRDDEKLLKKALKRKEATKRKSEKAWAERSEGVQKSMKQRQQKREENIKKRKEEKALGKAGKKKQGVKKGKGRAGFEGSGFGGKRK